MKRIFTIVLCLILVLSLACCKGGQSGGASQYASQLENTESGENIPDTDEQQQVQSGADKTESNDKNATTESSENTATKPQSIQSELKAGAKVPVGCTYKTADGKLYKAGQKMPKTVSDGDEFTDSEYKYKYNFIGDTLAGDKGWIVGDKKINGWGVIALEHNKASYGPIRTSVNGKDVVSIYNTFALCDRLTQTPELPERLTDMRFAFSYCENLTKVGKLPKTLKNMRYAFAFCDKLVNAPATPKSVTDMSFAYNGCISLKTAPEIVDGVVNIDGIFLSCTKLKTVKKVPESVQKMEGAFAECESLTGEIIIDAKEPNYTRCFSDTAEVITLSGKSEFLQDMASTSIPGNVTVKEQEGK